MSHEGVLFGVERLPGEWRTHYAEMAYHAARLADDLQHGVLEPPSADFPHREDPWDMLVPLARLGLALDAFEKECHGVWLLPDIVAEQFIRELFSSLWDVLPRGVHGFEVVRCFGVSITEVEAAGLGPERERIAQRWASWVKKARESSDADPSPARLRIQAEVALARSIEQSLHQVLGIPR